ncbi:MAG: type IV secretory system conjugative DNA transfer family protein [Alphaproteobacteria bacterium]
MRRFLLTTGLVFSVVAYPYATANAGILPDPRDGYSLPVDREVPITDSSEEPVEIENLMDYEAEYAETEEDNNMPIDIRMEAIREAATSFGARGGLAKRTYQIRQELDVRARYLDKVFSFNQLLVSAPSGLLIEPPVITESMNSMLVDLDGQTAAVSDKIYNIIKNARIVSAPRTWRIYLEREWGEVLPPPDILVPQNDKEREVWVEHVAKGWKFGWEQADEIFRSDLARLESDFQGMIRYRMLLAQGMVSPPYALQIDRGITGGGDQMRVGDRAVQITGVPELITGAESWKPANQ